MGQFKRDQKQLVAEYIGCSLRFLPKEEEELIEWGNRLLRELKRPRGRQVGSKYPGQGKGIKRPHSGRLKRIPPCVDHEFQSNQIQSIGISALPGHQLGNTIAYVSSHQPPLSKPSVQVIE